MVIPNSSTFSSEELSPRRWRRFSSLLALSLGLLVLLSYSFVLLIDPYSSVPFSLPLERSEVALHQQRLFYPALARDQRFDSALIGNSNIRLIRPDMLNQSLGGEWVNLAMNAASSWEQQQIFNLFVRNHSEIQNIFVGLDYLWCVDKYAEKRAVGARTEAGFPAWLYDENTINDLPPLNLGSLQHAWWQLLTATGLREKQFGDDGYTVFTKPQEEYSLRKARRAIYGADKPKPVKPVVPAARMSKKKRRQLPIPALSRLVSMLDQLPDTSRKILLFAPYHSYYQPRPGSKNEIIWNECKRRVVNLAANYPRTYVLDFMIRSRLTAKDSNYWDHKHYIVAVGNQLTSMIGGAVANGDKSENYHILLAPGER
jgi:hypothetical protein